MAYEVEIPEGTTVKFNGNEITVKGPKGEVTRPLNMRGITHEMNGNIMKIGCTTGKKEMVGTVTSHLKNSVHGVNEGFVYKLKICYSHFPINTSVAGNKFMIKNFIGEIFERCS